MRAGAIHETTAERYNPIIVAMARSTGGMQGLAKKLRIPYPRLVNWAKGEHVPDFSDPAIARRYKALDGRLVKLTGLMLVEVFGRPAQIERTLLPLREAQGQAYEMAGPLDLKIDLERALATLKPIDRDILIMNARGMTQEEIAERFNVSRARIGERLASTRIHLWRFLTRGPRKNRLAASY